MGKISTISAQCDRLRSIADDLVGMDYDAYAYDVRHAADTIKSLSYNLSDMVDCRERARELESENQKLRKLAQGLNWCTENTDGPRVDCERCPLGTIEGRPLELTCENMMRELGIEVCYDV